MAATEAATPGGVLSWIEQKGNKLPDPVFIFLWLIGFLVVISVVAAATGVSIEHPVEKGADGKPVIVKALSLLSAANLAKLWTEMPHTFAHFPPLGYVLTVMLGAGVAERSGLFAAGMRALVRKAPKAMLTPVVVFAGILGHLAADAAYVVLIPLAGVLWAAAGRNPIAGITVAFAGVSGGFSANILPGQLDALLLGITEAAARTLKPGFEMNIAGNWFFIAGMTVFFLPTIWIVNDRMIEPRLGKYTPEDPLTAGMVGDDSALTSEQLRGLRAAGLAALGVIALWLVLTFGPGTPLIDESAKPEVQLNPFYKSLIAAFFVLFLACGWAYGKRAGTIKDHRDVVRMMSEAMGDLAYYMVLAFMAAHFVAMFNWSSLGLIVAVNGANALEATGLPAPVLMGLLVLMSAFVDLIIGSASAKWALMAPVLVPMFMLLGVSPAMTTAAYRVGDSVTNIITPLMVYFPLVLTFCQRWKKDFGLGSLTATMLPHSMWLMIVGIVQTMLWMQLDIPLGPGTGAHYPIAR